MGPKINGGMLGKPDRKKKTSKVKVSKTKAGKGKGPGLGGGPKIGGGLGGRKAGSPKKK